MQGGRVILCITCYISDIDVRIGEEGKHVGFGVNTYINRIDIALVKGVHVAIWQEAIGKE